MLGYLGRWGLAFAAAVLLALQAFAGTLQLVSNINESRTDYGSEPEFIGYLGGSIVFKATDATGPAMWISDGTTSGTRMLVRAYSSGVPTPKMFQVGDRYYFEWMGSGSSNGIALWSTDGTPQGTRLDVDAQGNRALAVRGVFNGRVLFVERDADSVLQLYITDGTASGTQRLTNFTSEYSFVGGEFKFLQNKFYFAAQTGRYTGQLLVSDGTPAGTREIHTAVPEAKSFVSIGDRVLFTMDGLYEIDVATDTVTALRASGVTTDLVNMGDFVMFGALGVGTVDLWRSDGTAEGTYLVHEVDSARDPYDVSVGHVVLGKVGNRVIYRGKDAANGRELWSSDGTTANTIRLTNVPFPDSFQWGHSLGIVAGRAFFMLPYRSEAPITGALWETDGTVAGTRRVAGIPDLDHGVMVQINREQSAIYIAVQHGGYDPLSSLYKYAPSQSAATLVNGSVLMKFNPQRLFHANDSGRLFFPGGGVGTSGEPWVSDGTAAGTHLLVDIRAAVDPEYGSFPGNFTDFNGALVFSADDGFYGPQLWTSDGSAAGTRRVAELSGVVAGMDPSRLIVMNGALYFFAWNNSPSLIKLTSLQAAPEVLGALMPYRPESGEDFRCAADGPLVWNDKIYFIGQEDVRGAPGLQLWSTDGTRAGTVPLGGIGWACDLTQANNRLYFSTATAEWQRVPWVSDGTAAGTVPLAMPAGVSYVRGYKAVAANVYFSASDSTRGTELWRIDASGNVVFAVDIIPGPEGSYPTPIGALNGKLMLVVHRGNPTTTREMWISDGTPAGTTQLAVLANAATYPAILNGKAYFNRIGPDGVEIWVTDGTSAGTVRLADTSSNADAGADWFEDFHGLTVFQVTYPDAVQIWRTNGTPAGTTLIASKVPGVPPFWGPVTVRDRLAVGSRFFFGANMDAMGPELYALTNDLPLASADTAFSSNGGAVTVNVVSNDSDADGSIDPATVRIWTTPAHGTAVALANGSIVYTPTAGFGGTDTFSYVVDDNQRGTSTPATVTVDVTAAPGVTTTGKRGGGGALGFAELLMFLALLTIRVTRQAAEA